MLAARLPFFALHQGAMGSNCAEPRATVRALVRSACTVEVAGDPDGAGIHEVRVGAPHAICPEGQTRVRTPRHRTAGEPISSCARDRERATT